MLDKKFTLYAEQVLSGEIIAGTLIKKSCLKYLDFINGKNPDVYFDPARAERPVNFALKLKHWLGALFAGKPFTLLEWLKWCCYYMFGFYKKSSGRRLIRTSYIQIARKNGKSSLCAVLGLYGMIADGEPGSEIDIASPSNKLSQALFEHCSHLCNTINKGDLFKILRNKIKFPAKNGFIQMMSPDVKFGDGFNSHFAILDEFHALNTNELPGLLSSSLGMRMNPMLIYITTAGFNLNSPCKLFRDMCIDILFNKKQDDTIFSAIYEMDPEDLKEWENSKNWIKCVPSLGLTVTVESLLTRVQMALNNSAEYTNVLTKDLNIWCSSKSLWIPDNLLNDALQKIDIKLFIGEVCYGGIDLAAVRDLTCFSVMFPPNNEREFYPDKFIFKNFVYICEDGIRESPNEDLYRQWIRDGYLIKTPGNVTDYEYIRKDMNDVFSNKLILKIGYDKWNATLFVTDCLTDGYPMEAFSLAIGNFNGPTREFERLIRSGRVIIDYSPLIKWCIGNVELKEDHCLNVKPTKSNGNTNNKIDPVISMILSLGTMMNMGCYDGSIIFSS